MYADSMPLDHMLHETTKHGSPDFPIQFYIDELYKFHNMCVPLHWHFEPEFFVAKGGTVRIQVGKNHVILNPNDGIFISSNILHRFEQLHENDKCQCPNIVFSTDLIAPITSILYQKYVKPILMNQYFPYFILHSDILWQKEILDKLSYVFALLQKYGPESAYGPFPTVDYGISDITTTCFEMQVQFYLNQIWQILFSYMDKLPMTIQDKKELQSQVRLQHMISFIQENYMNPMTLQDISRVANISKSESSRCFHTSLDCAPVEYLLQYRIITAQKLLQSTQYSINEICFMCGFNSPSYFTKVFREKIGMTPGAYRIHKISSI